MNPESIFRVGDFVQPRDRRNEIDEFTFEISDESQIQYWPRASKFMIHSPLGIGFWEDEMQLAEEEEEHDES